MSKVIKDINKFTNVIARDVFERLSIDFSDASKYITFKQAKNMVKATIKVKNNQYILEEESLKKISSDMFAWVLGCQMSKMAAQDQIDCYWDNDINEIRFKEKIK